MSCSAKDNHEPLCLGTAILGERGQIVIPREARKILGLKTGDQFMVVVPHKQVIGIIPIKQAKKFLNLMNKQIESISEKS